jgi:Flp pilus assembly protein TadD
MLGISRPSGWSSQQEEMTSKNFLIAGLLGMAVITLGATAKAELSPLKQSGPPSAADTLAGQAAAAEIGGDYEKALQLADKAIKADPKEAWSYYVRGDALASLRRVDDSVVAFRQSEQLFPAADIWGRSVAIWGSANVLRQVGRCQDASAILERYASFVEQFDSEAAAFAHKTEKECVPPSGASTPR